MRRSDSKLDCNKNNDNPLVMKTLHKALDKNPGATPILHSDRVFQYTSKNILWDVEGGLNLYNYGSILILII